MVGGGGRGVEGGKKGKGNSVLCDEQVLRGVWKGMCFHEGRNRAISNQKRFLTRRQSGILCG